MLELAYPIDWDEIVRLGDIGFSERWRWRETGYSPFGIVVRADRGPDDKFPFPTWQYAPPFLPGNRWTIGDASWHEPLYMIIPTAVPGSRSSESSCNPSVMISCTSLRRLSPVARVLAHSGVCRITPSRRAEMDLQVAGSSVETLDLRPDIPLIIRNVRRESVTVKRT